MPGCEGLVPAKAITRMLSCRMVFLFTLNNHAMDFQKRMIAVFIGSVAFVSTSFGQQSLKPAVERLFNKIESDIVTAAEAMPEDKFNFTPESLDIANSNFKGVRTFGGQILHLATDNIFMWSAITGDSVRADIEDVNGPKPLLQKRDH